MSIASTPATTTEHADLLQLLAQHRFFLRFTVRDLSNEQAAQRPTASELCLGGIIRHVANAESAWVDFIIDGPGALGRGEESDLAAHNEGFKMRPDDTLASLLEHYERVAHRTNELVGSLPDLDASHPLPDAPWFERGARWSARRVLVHIIAETAQHAGHADIIRETLDGQKTMG